MTSVRVNIDGPDDGGSYVVSGLQPSTNYAIRVAAVNDVGMGTFASAQAETVTGLSVTINFND